MPNEKVLSEKQAIVAELADKLKRASAVYLWTLPEQRLQQIPR